jgi:hypothetical protein
VDVLFLTSVTQLQLMCVDIHGMQLKLFQGVSVLSVLILF